VSGQLHRLAYDLKCPILIIEGFLGMNFNKIAVLTLSLGALASAPLHASYFTDMPKSRVDSYRVKSQYGPEISILNPLFPKDQKLEFSFMGAFSQFSSLQTNWGYGGSIVYHINRRHAIEPFWFQLLSSSQTSFLETQIAAKTPFTTNGYVSLPKWMYSASYIFTPFYSKMSVTEMTVAHWDVYASVGFGLVKSETQSVQNGNALEEATKGAFVAGVGLRLLVPYRWGIRMELRDFIHKSDNFGKSSITNSLQMTAGLSIFFGAFPDYTSL